MTDFYKTKIGEVKQISHHALGAIPMTLVRLAAFPCNIVGKPKTNQKSRLSLGNSAGPENPLGVIFMQNVRPDNEFDVLTAFSLHPLWAFSLTLVPWES